MIRFTGLALALLGALLVGCANGDDGHMNGDDHDMRDGAGMDGGGGHDSMDHEGMDHGSDAATLPAGANRLCPVMEDEVSPDIYTEYKGKKVYFCCDDCIEKFKESPDEYFSKAYPDAGR